MRRSSLKDQVYRDIDAAIGGKIQGGKGYAHWGTIRIHLKRQSPETAECYELFNEAVATELARFCGLPVLDQFFFIQDGDIYSVTPFIADKQRHPPLRGSQLEEMLSSTPHLTHGMILFDLWVANNDRRAANLQYGRESDSLYLIDFGNALLYRADRKGVKRLEEMEKNPENLYIEPGKQYEYTSLLYDPQEVDFWCGRFLSIPEWMIENAVEKGNQIIQGGSLPVEAKSEPIKSRVFDFLVKRRKTLKLLVGQLAQVGIFNKYKIEVDPEKSSGDERTERTGEGW